MLPTTYFAFSFDRLALERRPGRREMSILVELPLEQYNKDAFRNFDPDAGGSPGNALAMIWMSQLAYETGQPQKVPEIARRLQLDRVDIVREPAKSTLPMSDTRGVIASK